MKFPRIRLLYIGIALIVITSLFVSLQIFPVKSTANMVVFIVTVMSLVVSSIAFYISTKTYVSIDSVNAITQMEGNVLENEHYVASVTSLLLEYDQGSSREVGELIFKNLEKRFSKHSKTAIEFADNLQYFIDVIVFFPFLFNSGDELQQNNISRMNRLIKLLDKRKAALMAISTGNLTLIEETVKLIKCVIHYQELINTNQYKITSALLEVRGSMLKNSVTRTVYYNYLGLFYNKKAMYVLRTALNIQGDFFEINNLKYIKEHISMLSGEKHELFLIYLEESRKAYSVALESSKDDIMWPGFIKYNDARSTLFLELLNPEEGTTWETLMNDAIRARNKLNILIDDILDKSDSTYMQKAFEYQEYLSRLVKINIQIALEQNITDTRSIVLYTAPDYNGILQEAIISTPYTGTFNRITKYKSKLNEYFN